ncbi:hypothetical protein IT575_10690 [bacterium]|nr:hypothetical protein [bacterium]
MDRRPSAIARLGLAAVIAAGLLGGLVLALRQLHSNRDRMPVSAMTSLRIYAMPGGRIRVVCDGHQQAEGLAVIQPLDEKSHWDWRAEAILVDYERGLPYVTAIDTVRNRGKGIIVYSSQFKGSDSESGRGVRLTPQLTEGSLSFEGNKTTMELELPAAALDDLVTGATVMVLYSGTGYSDVRGQNVAVFTALPGVAIEDLRD